MTKRTRVATGASYGAIATTDHARKAVETALGKMIPDTVGSVLLFLTNGYAYEPERAIREAAKAAGTTQIFGCCAKSLLTEEEWLLDVEGAVAMVFPRDLSLRPLAILEQQNLDPRLLLTLATPNAAVIAVNSAEHDQCGAITTDDYGHGPYSVWQSGRIVEREFTHVALPDVLEHDILVCEGIQALSDELRINRAKDHSLYEVNEQAASTNLLEHVSNVEPTDYFGLLCAVSETTSPNFFDKGHYRLHHVISVDRDAELVRLSGSAKAGNWLAWATRDADTAKQVVKRKLADAAEQHPDKPEFALMFPNISRGAEFFGGVDEDLLSFQASFPNTPMIGFYGNAEIAPGAKFAGLIRHYATVVSLFWPHA